MSEILPGLWLGNLNCTYDYEFLHEARISHVVTILESDHGTPAMADLHLKQLSIRMYDSDTEPIYDVFERACAFIHMGLTKGSGVYVHCLMGMSRSPTLVAAYLIKYHGLSDKEAIDFLVSKRPIVDPNDGFRAALARWYKVREEHATTTKAQEEPHKPVGNTEN